MALIHRSEVKTLIAAAALHKTGASQTPQNLPHPVPPGEALVSKRRESMMKIYGGANKILKHGEYQSGTYAEINMA